MAEITEFSGKDLDKKIRGKKAMIEFYSGSAGLSQRIFDRILKSIVDHHGKDMVFGRIDADRNMSAASAYGIESMPAIVFFRDGKPVDVLMGAIPRHSIINKIKQLSEEEKSEE